MSGFLYELKRRNVLRVAVLYVVISWIILQVAGLLVQLLELPSWTGKLVLALLILAFPLVLLFAWAFEITPEGIKREAEVDRSQSITHQTGRKLNLLTAVMAGIAILLIAAQGFIPGMRRSGSGSDRSSTVKSASIAVLPFVNMSSDKEQEYFSDGLSEELLNLLARIPQLTVISRTSSFQFKGKNEDVRDIGQKLGVAHVLEGSVRKSANKVRITAQLIKASDGSHVWSNTYDKTLDDIFAVQDQIAAEVVKALEVSLLGREAQVHASPQNTAAYNFLLQARHFTDQRSTEGSKRALAYLDSALAIDGNYAVAYAERARVIQQQVGRGDIPIQEGSALMRTAAQRALELDPKLPEAHTQLASAAMLFDWDWAAAERHVKEAEAIDPGKYATLLVKANLAATLGRFQESMELYRRGAQLNPLNGAILANLAQSLARVDSFDTALATYQHSLELNPGAAGLHAFIASVLLFQNKPQEALAETLKEQNEVWRVIALPFVYHALGKRAESDRAMRDLEQRFGAEGAYQVAEAHAYRGEVDLAFNWLDRAYQQRDPGITEILGDPFMKNIARDPRYRVLLRKLKLPES